MSTTLPKTRYLTLDATARVLGVPRTTVSAMIRRRELRTVRRRGRVVVASSEIGRLLGGAG